MRRRRLIKISRILLKKKLIKRKNLRRLRRKKKKRMKKRRRKNQRKKKKPAQKKKAKKNQNKKKRQTKQPKKKQKKQKSDDDDDDEEEETPKKKRQNRKKKQNKKKKVEDEEDDEETPKKNNQKQAEEAKTQKQEIKKDDKAQDAPKQETVLLEDKVPEPQGSAKPSQDEVKQEQVKGEEPVLANNSNDIPTVSSIDDEIESGYNSTQGLGNQDIYQDVEMIDAKIASKTKKRVRTPEEEFERKMWEEKVTNFLPTDLLTLKVKPRTQSVFFEDIKEIPSNITVAFYINDENQRINFQINGPVDNLMFEQREKGQLFYIFEARSKGVHKFVLDNRKSKSTKKVTFAIHSGNNFDEHVRSEHIHTVYRRIDRVAKGIKEVQFHEKMMVRKFEGHYETTKSHNTNIVLFSLLETGIMVVILIVQLVYIKRLIGKF